MSNSKLVISIELSGKEKLEDIIEKLSKKYKLHADADFADIGTSLKTQISALDDFKRRAKELGLVMNGISSAIGAVVGAYNATVRKFVESAAEFEQLQLRLESLYQDADKAAAAFEKFRQVAAQTPATLKGVVEAGATLKAFGLDAENVLDSVADLAAYMGMDIVEAAQAVGRAFAGGVGAADVLRERGVLELIKSFKGVEDLTKLTLPQFREAMLETFSDAAAGIAGSSDRMAESYTGAVANMQDAMESLYAAIGNKITPIIGAAANALAKLADKLSGTKSGLDAVKEGLVNQRVEFEKLVLVYKELHFRQNRSKEENEKYRKTINDLMTKYPNYLGNIDLEKGAWEDIAAALNSARIKLQEWINAKIKQAIIDDKTDDYVKLYKKLNEKENQLKTLQAEFEAGTKKREAYRQAAPDPLSSSPNMPRLILVSSKWAKQEEKLEKDIKKLKAEIKKADKEIEQLVSRLGEDTSLAPSNEESNKNKGKGKGSGKTGGADSKKTELDQVISEITEYRILRENKFNEEQTEIELLKREYTEKLKLVAKDEAATADLVEKRDREVAAVQKKYQEEREEEEAAHYEKLRFYLEDFYTWKINKIEEQAKKESLSEEWKQDQIKQLEQEKEEWGKRGLIAFEEEYAAEMSHLAELRELGIATYSETASKAWEYYDTLKAIVEADGEESEEERELLNIYRKRAQAAQLAVNRESDTASYYETAKFLDEGYFEWKKRRIEEDVSLMNITEEQKAIILKQNLEELQAEYDNFRFNKDIFGQMMDALDIPASHQARIINSFQELSKHVSSIWQQMYANLSSQRDHSLKQLENRAKKEHKTDVWLAKEKEKVEEEYAAKQKQMKKTEQKMQIASAISNTAEGVTNALTLKPAWFAPVMAAAALALGTAQVGLIAQQKFWRGGLVRGKGSDTSDSNLVALSNNEYVIRATRVRELGVPFLDALNSGSFDVKKAVPPIAPRPAKPVTSPQKVVLVCDGRELARAVTRGNRRILST
jgi:hypothetical protein